MNFKYIIFDGPTGEEPILFPPWINHDDMARKMGRKAISAGFVKMADDDVTCYGKSLSLNLRAREEDSHIVEMLLIG